MFASEKVMLDYLGQLLQEEPEEQETLANAKPAETMEVEEAKTLVSEPEPQQVEAKESTAKLRPIVSRKTNPLDFVRSMSQSRTINPVETAKAASPTVAAPEPEPERVKPKVAELKPFAEPDIPEPSAEAKSVEKLLQQVSVKQQEEKIAKEQQKTVDLVRSVTQSTSQVVEKEEEALKPAPTPVPVAVEAETFPQEPFQALFFDVAGLVLAVPLQELGGIHNLTEVNSLFGKPDWFRGVMVNREKKLNIVDSARWVMPEKHDKNMEESLNYQYVIMLGESEWGLAAEKLVETESINPDQVKWRTKPGKRPWLMGTIKEKMCALLHVSDLIAMLEQGVNARQE